MDVLFFGKECDPFVQEALNLLRSLSDRVRAHIGNRHQRVPEINGEGFDLVISYLSPWIIPSSILKLARVAAINFHPAPPEYPGIGCTNFALYEGVTEYGVTCHQMNSKVDTGAIVAVSRFPVDPKDSVYSLTQRCYQEMSQLFTEIMPDILAGKPVPESSERWARRPFTREELNALCEVKSSMNVDEIRRRVRATTYPGMPGAYVMLGGIKFLAEPTVQLLPPPLLNK